MCGNWFKVYKDYLEVNLSLSCSLQFDMLNLAFKTSFFENFKEIIPMIFTKHLPMVIHYTKTAVGEVAGERG